jgi:hypothetical protein
VIAAIRSTNCRRLAGGILRRVFFAFFLLGAALLFGPAARAQQQMVTVAGITTGVPFSNYGTQTTSPSNAVGTGLHFPNAVAVDGFGNFYIADGLNDAIREVGCGNMTAYANLLDAPVNDPAGTEATAVATDPLGDVFYADSIGNIFQNKTDRYPLNTTGSGTFGYYVVPKQIANLGQWVLAMTADAQGNVYVLSGTNNGNGGYTNIGISKIVPPTGSEVMGTVTTISAATSFAPAADNFDSQVQVGGLAIDAAGNLYTYVYDGSPTPNAMYNQILEITQAGAVSDFGFTGFDQINGPILGSGLALAPNSAGQAEAGQPGTFYMAFNNTGRIYAFVPPNGDITPSSFTAVAGSDARGYNGDGPATESYLNEPNGIGLDPSGALYIADTGNNLVRNVANPGYVSGSCGAGGFGTPGAIPNYGFGRMNTTTDEYYLAVDHGNYTNGGPLGAVVAFSGITGVVESSIVTANGSGTASIPTDMAVDSVNNFVYEAASDGTIYVIDGATNTLLTSFATGSKGLASIAVDPGTDLVYAVGTEDTHIYILQGPTRGNTGSIIAPAQLLTPIGGVVPLGSVAVDTQRHMAYAIVSGVTAGLQPSLSLAVINGTTSPPTLSTSVAYIANPASTDIAHDALGVETASGKVVIADAEDENVSVYDPSQPADAAFQIFPMGFYPNHVAVDSVHQNAYIADGYGNAKVIGVTTGTSATINSITIGPDAQACGPAGGALGVDAAVDQAYVTTCDPVNGAAIALWDGTLQQVIATYELGSASGEGSTSANFSITVNPFIHSVYLNESLPSLAAPQVLVFNGTAATAETEPILKIGPNPLYVSPIAVGGAFSPAPAIEVQNAGGAPATIGAFILNPLGLTGTLTPGAGCAPLVAGASCDFDVTVPTSSAASFSGTVVFSDNDPTTPQLVPYSGTVGITSLSFTPTAANFGTVPVDTSPTIQIIVTNTGSGPLTITNVAYASGATSDLGTYNNCEVGGAVAAGGSCTITVEYNPANPETASGMLKVTDNVPGSPQTIAVSATAVAQSNGNGGSYGYGIFTQTVGFGDVQVNEPSVTQEIVIENEGEGALGLGSIAIEGANAGDFHFLEPSTCGASLAPFAECVMYVYFEPTALATEPVPETAEIVVPETNSTVTSQTITLLGTSSLALGAPTSLPELVSAANLVPQVAAAPSNGGTLQTPFPPSISSGGQFVAFSFQATNLPGAYQVLGSPLSSVYLRNTCVNQGTSCEQGTTFVAFGPATGPGANGGAVCGGQSLSPGSEFPVIDSTGRYVAFTSDGCVPAGTTTTTTTNQIFLRDTYNNNCATTNCSTVVSLNSSGAPVSLGVVSSSGGFPGINPFAMSANARFFAYQTTSPNVVSGVANAGALNEIYWQDACTGQTSGCLATQLISQPAGTTNVVANATAEEPAISPDGRYVAFASTATNLSTNPSAAEQAYLRDTCYGAAAGCTPTTTLISALANGNVAGGTYPSVSSGGRFVAFVSSSTSLVTAAGATAPPSAEPEIYLQDTCSSGGTPVAGCTPTTTLLSQFNGIAATSSATEYPFVSADGRLVTFTSSSKLTTTATTGVQWVYKYDRCQSNGVAVGGGCSVGLSLISSNPSGGNLSGGGAAVIDASDEFIGYNQGSMSSFGYPVAEIELGSAEPSGTSPITLPTTTALALSLPGPVALGQPVTLTATVSPTTGSGTPTGTVTFVNGATALTAPVNLVSGVAALTSFTGLPAGAADSITAVYNGSTSYSTSTSTPVVIDVGPPIATFSPVTVHFANATLNQTNTTATVTLTNSAAAGSQPLVVPIISVTLDAGSFDNEAPFGLSASNVTCNGAPVPFEEILTPVTINPSVSCIFPVIFQPANGDVTLTSSQSQNDTLTFDDNAPTTNALFSQDMPSASVPNAQDSQTITLEAFFVFPASVTLAGPATATATAGAPVTFTANVAPVGTFSSYVPSGTVTFLDGGVALPSVAGSPNPAPLVAGAASYTTSSLAVGTHSLTATYSGDTNFGSISSLPPFTETITSSSGPPPAMVMDNETIVVADTPSLPDVVDAETITVTDTPVVHVANAIVISPAALLPAILNKVYPNLTFSATGGFGGVTLSESGTIPGVNFTGGATVVVSGTPTSPGSFPFTITATDSFGAIVTANYTLTVNPACQAIAVTPAGTLTPGALGISYEQLFMATGGVGTIMWFTSGPVTPGLAIGPTTGVLSGSPTTVNAAPPSFTVIATDQNGCTGSASVSVVVSAMALQPAMVNDNETILVTDTPNLPDISGAEQIIVTDTPSLSILSPTIITLTASQPAVSPGTTVTFTAKVSSAFAGTPTGTVTFYLNGATNLGVLTLSGTSGMVTTGAITLPTGVNIITATYSGDAHFLGSTVIPGVTVGVGTPDYSITANPNSLTIAAGASGTTTLTLAGNAYLPSTGITVTLSCGNVPFYVSCKFTPPTPAASTTSVTLTSSASTANVTLTVSVAAVLSARLAPRGPTPFGPIKISPIMLALMVSLGLLGLLPLLRRNSRRWTRVAGALLLCVAIAGAIAGCATARPPAGMQSITINATGGGESHPIPLIINITN